MRHLFIINPAAGRPESTARLETLLSRLSFPHEVAYTREAGDAQRLAATAARTGGLVRIYACGGDGTLNEVVNGAAGFDNAAVTCVPNGTGNDFLKLFGPRFRELFYDLEALAAGPQRAFDLMDCNGKLGIGVVCAGVDARVAAGVHAYKSLPLVSGSMAYVLSLVVNVIKDLTRPTVIDMGEIHLEGESTIICICNGRWYGGSFNPVPDAEPDDGLLDVLIVEKVNLLQVAGVIGKYQKGHYADYPHLIRHVRCHTVRVECEQENVVNVDGEAIRTTDAQIELIPQAIRFFYPRGLTYRCENSQK